MNTLDSDPTYELLPMGVVLRGRPNAEDYYKHFFANVRPLITGFTMRSEWITDEGVGQEYQVFLDGPDGPRRYDIVGILIFGADGLLSGERIYASDDLIRIMFGPLLERAVPLGVGVD